MTYIPDTEWEMVETALASLSERNVPSAVEVPFLNRSIDLVIEDTNGTLIAIEFKRHNWKRAIIQANDHRLGTHFVYICLPKSKVSAKVKKEATQEGIGVMAWSIENPLEIIIEPQTSNLFLPELNNWLRERFLLRKSQGVLP